MELRKRNRSGGIQVFDGDTLGVIHGGTGLATVGANRILTGNGTSD